MKGLKEKLKILTHILQQDKKLMTSCYGHLYSLRGRMIEPEEVRLEKFKDIPFMRAFLARLFGFFLEHLEAKQLFAKETSVLQEIFNSLYQDYLDEKILSLHSQEHVHATHLVAHFEKIRQRKRFMITTGYPEHAIHLFFSNDKLYRINTGACRVDHVIECFQIQKPEALTHQLIGKIILDRHTVCNKDFIHRHLHNILGLTCLQTFESARQSAENCMYFSGHVGLLAMLLEHLPQSRAYEIFKCWEQWSSTQTLSLLEMDLGKTNYSRYILQQFIWQKVFEGDNVDFLTNALGYLGDISSQALLQWSIQYLRLDFLQQHKLQAQIKERFFSFSIDLNGLDAELSVIARAIKETLEEKPLRWQALGLDKKGPEQTLSFQGFSLMHFAVALNNLELTEVLLRLYPQFIHQQDFMDALPIHYAKTPQMVELLAKHGGLMGLEENSSHPLFDVMDKQNYSLASSLLATSPLLPKEVLHWAAASYGKLEFGEILQHHQSLLFRENFQGQSALHQAAKTGKLNNVKLIVGQGEYPDKQDVNGLTPLYVALQKKQKEVAFYLLAHPCTSLELQNFRKDDGYKAFIKDELDLFLLYHQQLKYKKSCQQRFLQWQKETPIAEADLFFKVLVKQDHELLIGCLQTYPLIALDALETQRVRTFLPLLKPKNYLWHIIEQVPGFDFCIEKEVGLKHKKETTYELAR